MLCSDLNGKEVQKGEDRICICMANSCCCAVDSDTAL